MQTASQPIKTQVTKSHLGSTHKIPPVKINKLKNTETLDWAALVTEWESSTLHQKLFCQQKNINYSQFVYYKSQLKNKMTSEPKLLPVKVMKPEQQLTHSHANHFILSRPNGVKLYIPPYADEKTLKILLTFLGE